MRTWLVVVVATVGVNRAGADGFVTAPGEVRGTVTDNAGHGVSGAKVHVTSAGGKDQVITARVDGTFGPVQVKSQSVVHVDGDLRLVAGTAVSRKIGGTEAIEVDEAMAPAVAARALTSPDVVGEYTDEAFDADAWTRANVLLEVGVSGRVTRLKLLDAAGYGLDRIAIRDAFKLRFEPALDATKRPVRSNVVWTFEWPSFSWMKLHHARRHLPRAVSSVPCAGTDSSRDGIYRDCRAPDLANALAAPWIDRPRK
jgi:hypothetical protein